MLRNLNSTQDFVSKFSSVLSSKWNIYLSPTRKGSANITEEEAGRTEGPENDAVKSYLQDMAWLLTQIWLHVKTVKILAWIGEGLTRPHVQFRSYTVPYRLPIFQ